MAANQQVLALYAGKDFMFAPKLRRRLQGRVLADAGREVGERAGGEAEPTRSPRTPAAGERYVT